jgi:hypothetical protein
LRVIDFGYFLADETKQRDPAKPELITRKPHHLL